MQLRTLPVSLLKPAPYNPRIVLQPGMPGYDRLKRSLTEFGLVQPIIWNESTGHIVGGHQRLAILEAEGITETEVSVVQLPLEKEQALNIALNNTHVGSDWDHSKLQELVAELTELPDFDATLTGFSEAELRELNWQPQPVVDLSTPDPGSELVEVSFRLPPAEWTTLRPHFDEWLASHQPHVANTLEIKRVSG
jgi:ParB-like nuclease domain